MAMLFFLEKNFTILPKKFFDNPTAILARVVYEQYEKTSAKTRRVETSPNLFQCSVKMLHPLVKFVKPYNEIYYGIMLPYSC
jgi:hypothetical protein